MQIGKQIKRASIIVIVVLLVGVVAIHAQQENPVVEIPVLDGEDVAAVFEDGVYTQLYAFVGEAGDVVSIQMNRAEDSEIDPYLILLDSNGAVLAADDDGGYVVRDAFIDSFELPEDGLYFVFATFAEYILLPGTTMEQTDTLPPMSYTLVTEGIQAPENVDDVFLDFTPEELQPGDTLSLEVSQEAPVVYVVFSGQEGDAAAISTAQDGDQVDTILYLFTGDGQGIGVNDDGQDLGVYSSLAGIELPQDGLYLVFATSYQFYNAPDDKWENVGTFTLSFE